MAKKTTKNTAYPLPYLGQTLAIDPDLALGYLSKYLTELDLLRSGVSAKELYQGRKEASRPMLLSATEEGVEKNPFTKENIQSKSGQFAHLKLSGVMQMEDGLCSFGVNHLVDAFRQANASPNIAGILLEVNSGGGEVTAGQAIHTAVKESTKPVVALIHNAGSAALMGILHCKKIIMGGNNARIGSIGVFTAYSKWMVRYLKNYVGFVYSDTSPDKNAASRLLINSDDTSLLKKEVNRVDTYFEREVVKARELKGDEDKQRDTLNGGFFFASDGVRRGLADSVGTFNSAVAALQKEVRATSRTATKKNTNMGLIQDIKAVISKAEGGEKKEEKQEQPKAEATLDAVMEKLNSIATDVAKNGEELKAIATTSKANTEAIKAAGAKVDNLVTEVGEIKETVEEVETKQEELESNQKDLEETAAEKAGGKVAKKGNKIADPTTAENAFNNKVRELRLPDVAKR